MPGFLKTILPIVSAANILLNLVVMLDPASMLQTFASSGDVPKTMLQTHVEAPFAAQLVFQLCTARIALYSLGIVAYFRGSGMRFHVGLAFLFAGLASLYSDVNAPFEFVAANKKTAMDVVVPFDLANEGLAKRLVLRLVLTAPILLGLVAHAFEPGLLTTDKKATKATKTN